MRRLLAIPVAAILAALVIAPAGAATKTVSEHALKGEARGLELAVLGEGVTLGFALAQADSTPKALGVGAGQCTLLGNSEDPEALPCSNDTMVKSAYPGNPGSDNPTCKGGLPAPIDSIIDLKLACGASSSSFSKGVATTRSKGSIAELKAKLPVGLSLVPIDLKDQTDEVKQQVQQIVNELTGALAPVLDAAPSEVRDTIEGAPDTVFEQLDGLLEVIQNLDVTDALKAEVGISRSSISRSGRILQANSDAAGARIGLIGIPTVGENGNILQPADPLKNGLVIIEVGTARASASVDRKTAGATSAASPALVTVKVRDITSPTPKYVEVSVAPGQTVTLLEGTPAETTIVAADSETKEEPGSAEAVANAVRIHALKGVNNGVELGLAGANAAATGEVNEVLSETQNRPPRVLPQTGAMNLSVLALLLLSAGLGGLIVRKRLG